MSSDVPLTFDRYIRFRHFSSGLTPDGFYTRVKNEGVMVTYFGEDIEVTFAKRCHPTPGDLLEVEYPASYCYFLFGENGGGKWEYTRKN